MIPVQVLPLFRPAHLIAFGRPLQDRIDLHRHGLLLRYLQRIVGRTGRVEIFFQETIGRAPRMRQQRIEHLLLDLFQEIDPSRPCNTRELLHLLGRRLSEKGLGAGMVTTAAKLGLPIYCPAIADSELGIDLLYGRMQRGQRLIVDTIADIGESSELIWQTHLAAGQVGIITIGGGTPRNFIQQTAPCLDCMGRPYPGHKYAIGITTDVPYWGGLSGSTFEEAESWRKYNHPQHATVRADATIAFPLLCGAAFERIQAGHRRPALPRFSFSDDETGVRFESAE